MRDLFEKGFSYRSFVLNQPKEIRIKLVNNYIPMNIGEEQRNRINSVVYGVKILGIVEGDCPDTQIYLPVLEKLISTNNKIELRLLTKSYIADELKDFEIDGKVKLPTFIFMDAEYKILDAFVEKPKNGDTTAESAADEMAQIITGLAI